MCDFQGGSLRFGATMRAAQQDEDTSGKSVNPNQRIDQVAAQVVSENRPVPVRDDSGSLLGMVDREKLIAVLAGKEISSGKGAAA